MLSDATRWKPKKRIVKVLIPYVIWTFFYVVLANIKTPSAIPISYLIKLITGKGAAIMYYIFVYCEFTLLIPVIDKIARSKYKWIGYVIAPAEIVIMRSIPLIFGFEVPEIFSTVRSISCLGWFTYFYLGYLLGNNIIEIKMQISRLIVLWCVGVFLQILEGYWYYSIGVSNCGTQLKISVLFTSVIFVLMLYIFINTDKLKNTKVKWLYALGNYSFGIYFSHLAVMWVLQHISNYSYIIYPVNAIIAVFVSLICVIIGKRILGKYSGYLAL